MKTVSLQNRFAIGLRAIGFEEAAPTTHYRVFKKDGEPTFYLGKSGALRHSRTHKVTQTVVTGPKMRERILGNDAVPTHQHRGFFIAQRCPGDVGMIGLSLSLCVKDIIEGRVAMMNVSKIVAGTNYPDRETFCDAMKETYCRTYWRRAPRRALAFATRLWDEGRIDQPRLRGEDPPNVSSGHWQS